MAQYRNISDDTFTDVKVAGSLVGSDVGPDAVVDVPDELAALVEWPASVWQLVAAPVTPAPVAPTTSQSKE